MSGPAAKSEVARDRILADVKGDGGRANELTNLPYVDKVNYRVWYFNALDVSGDTGKARGVQIHQEDAQWHDLDLYVANSARWNGQFWKLTDVKKIIYKENGMVQDQKSYAGARPAGHHHAAAGTGADRLAAGAAHSRPAVPITSPPAPRRRSTSPVTARNGGTGCIYPFSVLVLMLYALLQGARSDRRSPVAGIGITIAVLIVFTIALNLVFHAGGAV